MISLSKDYNKVHVLPAFSDANIFMNKLFCLPITWDAGIVLETLKSLLNMIHL